MKHSGNTMVKAIVILAAVLLIVFGIAKRVAAPSEGELPVNGAEEIMEEGGMQLEGDNDGAAPKTVQDLPPLPTPPEPSCGVKNAVCATSDDCCGNLGLECQEVRTSDGGFGKRCLPIEARICRSDCENGIWQAPRACRDGVVPTSMQSCESFVSTECKLSPNEHRNTKECWDT